MLPAILHVTAAPGGGVDRHIRDLAAVVAARHRILHVGDRVDVLEDFQDRRFLPFPAGARGVLAALAHAATLVHVHGLGTACRDRLAGLRMAAGLPFVATLHDLAFAHPDLFEATPPGPPPGAWVDGVNAVLKTASAVLAPSRYIAGKVAAIAPGVPTTVIAPGVPARTTRAIAPPAAFLARRRRHVVAVVGAIGPHKGRALLPDVAAGLEACDASLVVIGYTDDTLLPGWQEAGFYVHGPYTDDALASWLAAYAPDVAFFPNRIPESFSYTLSEVWQAGIPVVVPDAGALGERVRRHGGGWLLPADFAAADAVALVGHLLAHPAKLAQVKSAVVAADSTRVPDLAPMAEAIQAVYARFGVAPEAGRALDLEALQPLLAASLDGFVFRAELVRVCANLAEAQAGNDRLEAVLGNAKAWNAKLEADVRELKAAVAARDATVQQLSANVAELARDKAILDRLPRLVRDVLTRWPRGARS